METPIEQLRIVFDTEFIRACTNLKSAVETADNRSLTTVDKELIAVLNKLFPKNTCGDVLLTNNTDKMCFGVYVSPTITDENIIKIILSDEQVQIERYTVEIDTSICNYLEPAEIAAYIVESVSSMMDSNMVSNIRGIIDTILMDNDTSIDVVSSANYSQILIFGVKDVMRKLSDPLYKPEDTLGVNDYATGMNLHGLLDSAKKKINGEIYGDTGELESPKLSILNWCLDTYKDVHNNYYLAERVLKKARELTGSVLQQREVDNTLKAVRRAVNETIVEGANLLQELSLFNNMKKNGLKGIEDDLYEFKIRLKSCEDEEEALYILRQVNTRISILEDYVYNTPNLSDREIKHWQDVIYQYRELRTNLSKKGIVKKKTYGVFVDYDQFDKIEN